MPKSVVFIIHPGQKLNEKLYKKQKASRYIVNWTNHSKLSSQECPL